MNGQIRELTNLEDFKKVYKVFSGPPYNEKYTEEELEEIFREYQEKGYMYGAYNKEECVGMIALERGVKEDTLKQGIEMVSASRDSERERD